jgi:hypothetical protein
MSKDAETDTRKSQHFAGSLPVSNSVRPKSFVFLKPCDSIV